MLKNGNELKIFKICTVYLRVRPFWIYITVSFFFFLNFSHLFIYVLKILSIKKKKNQKHYF